MFHVGLVGFVQLVWGILTARPATLLVHNDVLMIGVITATSAAIVGLIVLGVSYAPAYVSLEYPLPASARFGLSLLPNTAMAIGFDTLLQFVSTGMPVCHFVCIFGN